MLQCCLFCFVFFIKYEHSLVLPLYCTCLCCHSFLWYSVVFLSGTENVYRIMFVYKIDLHCRLRSDYQEGGTPLNGLTLPHFCVCPNYTSTWISNVICRCLLCVQWFEVGGDCSFCWYRSNCWPSLFKLPCHDCIN
jgi:hypothetical protein